MIVFMTHVHIFKYILFQQLYQYEYLLIDLHLQFKCDNFVLSANKYLNRLIKISTRLAEIDLLKAWRV